MKNYLQILRYCGLVSLVLSSSVIYGDMATKEKVQIGVGVTAIITVVSGIVYAIVKIKQHGEEKKEEDDKRQN